jgi:hypothetical protein
VLDAVEHRVDRRREPAGLLAAARAGHPRRQVAAARDVVRGPGHPVERGEPPADQPVAADREQGQQHATGDQLGEHEAAHLAGARRAANENDSRAGREQAGLAGGDDNRAPDGAQRRAPVQRQIERLAAARQLVQVRGHLGGRLARDTR